MGGAVAVIGVCVVVATAHVEEHQRRAEQDGQGNQQLGHGHGMVRRTGMRRVWRLLAWCELFLPACLSPSALVGHELISCRLVKRQPVVGWW